MYIFPTLAPALGVAVTGGEERAGAKLISGARP